MSCRTISKSSADKTRTGMSSREESIVKCQMSVGPTSIERVELVSLSVCTLGKHTTGSMIFW